MGDNDNSQHVFYIVYWIEEDVDVDGIKLDKGFYRYTYDLSGVEVPHACQFSTDRIEWVDCDLFKGLGEFQEAFSKIQGDPMRFEREDYIETIHYKGMSVPIFNDDYGQCFYCIFDNQVLSFGTFQSEYEDEVKFLVDREISRCEVNTPCDGRRQTTD